MAMNEAKLNAFLGKAVGDLGAAISAVLVSLGDDVGLDRELAKGPLTSEKLARGGRAADIGCGHGVSTILMAKAFPHSDFIGIDYHEPSIETARGRAAEAGVRNIRFETADATSYKERDLDFVAFFDCLHD